MQIDWRIRDFGDDVERLRKGLLKLGYEASRKEIARAWEDYSEKEFCAGWLFVEGHDSEDVLHHLADKYL